MPEKEPKKWPTPEQVLRNIGRHATRIEQIMNPGAKREITPGMIQHEDGTTTFLSEHKYMSTPDIIPLSRGFLNPNNN